MNGRTTFATWGDSEVIGNVARGHIDYDISFVDLLRTRLESNRAAGAIMKFQLTNLLGGNWIAGNEEIGSPPALWGPTAVASDRINP